MTRSGKQYVGRFAPSPSGPLHFGSLVAALGSFLEARSHDGQWRLRIDDIDPGRVVPGARDRILRTLEGHGFAWDGPIVEQSRRDALYAEAFRRLEADGWLYRCSCSRRSLSAHASRGPLGLIYPGTCRDRGIASGSPASTRVRLPSGPLAIDDATCGRVTMHPGQHLGDPVLRRRDGVWAYHLATTVDDAAMNVTSVVRGADLLPCALLQNAIREMLHTPAVSWRHLPLARKDDGVKLSKQTGAGPLDDRRPVDSLLAAWRLLGQAAPAERPASPAEFHDFAIAHWRPASIPHEDFRPNTEIPAPA